MVSDSAIECTPVSLHCVTLSSRYIRRHLLAPHRRRPEDSHNQGEAGHSQEENRPRRSPFPSSTSAILIRARDEGVFTGMPPRASVETRDSPDLL